MFDRRRRRVVVCRDRFGIKPLYWSALRNGLALASEIGVLASMDTVDSSVDAQALADFVTFHYIPLPATMYARFRALEPRCLLVADVRSNRPTWIVRR